MTKFVKLYITKYGRTGRKIRCQACDVLLTDYETTRKSLITNEYFDLCNTCFKTIKDDLAYKDRIDLASSGDMFELEDSEDDSFDNSDY